MNITPLIGPLADMLKSKKAIALALSLTVVGVLCYLGKVQEAQLLDFAKWLIAAYLAAEGVAKIGSTTSSDTPAKPADALPVRPPSDETIAALAAVALGEGRPLTRKEPLPPTIIRDTTPEA
ncbi:MAG: hypothetical protein WDA27_14620 [Actinomycetota bacterium]